MNRSLAGILAVTVAIIGTNRANASVLYTITDIGNLGGTTVQPFAINSSGEITGYASLPNGNNGAFLFDGTMHNLGSLGGNDSIGEAINDAGEVVGYSGNSSNQNNAFAFQNGTMQNLGPQIAAGGTSIASGVNSSGQIVGRYTPFQSGAVNAFVFDGTRHDIGTDGGHTTANAINASGEIVGDLPTTQGYDTYLYNGGILSDLGGLGGPYSDPASINNNGDITGSATVGGIWDAYFYNGTMHNLGSLNGEGSYGESINDNDQIVGNQQNGDPFIWDSVNGMRDLNSLIAPNSGWTLETAYGINDLGQITGSGSIAGEPGLHGFILTPVPEPSPIVLLSAGIVSLFIAFKSKPYRR